MALLMFEGFEWATTIDWTGSLDYSADTPRSGTGRMYDPDSGIKVFPIAATTTTIIIGVAYKAGVALRTIFIAHENANTHMKLNSEGGYLKLYRLNTLLETSVATWDFSEWQYIELKATIHDTTGSYEVRVNGQVAMSASGVDTRDGGVAGICNNIKLVGNVDTQYDDLYVLDSSGSINNDFLGPGARVLPCKVNAAGDDTDFTPLASSNYLNVDETPTPDGNTTYNASSTSGHRDLYNLEALTGQIAVGTVHGVRVKVSMEKDDVDAVSAKIAIKSGTTIAYGSDQACAEAYDEYEKFWETNPDDSAQWEFADIDALQAGLEVV